MTKLPNGDAEATTTRILSLDSARRPIGKKGDFITVQAAETMVAKALAEEVPKIHEFYLNQLPKFIAGQVEAALLHYGLIREVTEDEAKADSGAAPDDAAQAQSGAPVSGAQETPAADPSAPSDVPDVGGGLA